MGIAARREAAARACAAALLLLCAAAALPIAHASPADGPEPSWLAGYRRSFHGEVLGYQSPYPGPTPALLVRTTDGKMSAAWETDAIPAGFDGESATFAFMVGLASGYGAHRFELKVNGEPCCSFRSSRDTGEREWMVAGARGEELSFRTTLVGHFNEMFGFMFLKLPEALLTPGAPVRLEVVGESAGSQDYFMAFEKPAESWIESRAEEALVRTASGPAQLVRVDVSHIAPPAEVAIEAPGAAPLRGRLETGFNSFHLAVPAADGERALDLRVTIAGRPAKAETLRLGPVRRREIWLLPHSHVDIGYSDPQPEVERKQVANLRVVLELIRKTAEHPPDARFRWTSEVAWPVERFLAVATGDEKRAFGEALRAGSIELGAFYANELTGLCSPEELDRLTEFARRAGRDAGAPVRTAMITDIPGAEWTVVPSLARSGVRYFSSAPNYMPFLPDGGDRVGNVLRAWGDKPFWWVSPSGRERVLFWMAGRGYSWFHGMNAGKFGPEIERPVLDYMSELAETGYPYDLVQVHYTIGGDNGPPDPDLPGLVRKWNDEFESPRIVIATAGRMFEEFERRYGGKLPSFAGDLSPYWEDGAASTARETALNRNSSRRLVEAETLWAMLAPGRFPAKAFRDAWRDVLLFHEHTWGAWNSVSDPDRPEVVAQWEWKRARAVEADRRSRDLIPVALPLRASAPAGGGEALDVINTLSWPRGGVVLVPRERSAAGDRVTDESGRRLPSQRLASGELAVLVGEVPALGAVRLVVREGEARRSGRARAKGPALDNGGIRAEVDPRTGAISSLVRLGEPETEMAGEGGLDGYAYVPGRDPRQARASGAASVTIVDAGPLVATLRVESEAPGAKRLVRELRLAEGSDTLEVTNTLDKTPVRDKESVHFAFPFRVPGGVLRVDLGEAVVRPDTDQLAGACRDFLAVHSSVDVSNSTGGVTLTALDAPLLEIGAITDETLGKKEVRTWRTAAAPGTTVYSYAMNNYWHTNYMAGQEGETVLRYALRAHGPASPAAAARADLEATRPLLAFPVGSAAPPPPPPFELEAPDVIVRSLRPTDDGQAIVARLYNPSGEPRRVRLARGGRELPGAFLADPDGAPIRKIEWPVELPPFATILVGIPTFH